MSTSTPTDAEAFLAFLVDQVKNGGADKSPEQLLQAWRSGHSAAIDDIRQGIRDLETGSFRRFEDVDAEIRQKFGFAPRQA
jgi:hypothetical protein